MQVTLRAVDGLPSFRSRAIFPAVSRAIARAQRAWFRVAHFSVQQDHVHLIVEGDSRVRLIRGVQGLAIRVALLINRTVRRRGPVWGDRYHGRALTTPREVRSSMVYVLLNFRKHLRAAPGIDPCSSGLSFSGWQRVPLTTRIEPRWRAEPATWLARVGWLRAGGPLAIDERPADQRVPVS